LLLSLNQKPGRPFCFNPTAKSLPDLLACIIIIDAKPAAILLFYNSHVCLIYWPKKKVNYFSLGTLTLIGLILPCTGLGSKVCLKPFLMACSSSVLEIRMRLEEP